jgi:hypothetical protein
MSTFESDRCIWRNISSAMCELYISHSSAVDDGAQAVEMVPSNARQMRIMSQCLWVYNIFADPSSVHIYRFSGLPTLEHATYNCPCEKQSVRRSKPHTSNDRRTSEAVDRERRARNRASSSLAARTRANLSAPRVRRHIPDIYIRYPTHLFPNPSYVFHMALRTQPCTKHWFPKLSYVLFP